MNIENKLDQMLENIKVWDMRNLHLYLHYLHTLKDEGKEKKFYEYETKLQEIYAIRFSSCGMDVEMKGGEER